MKRFIALVLTAAMLISLVACGATGKGDNSFTPEGEGDKTESSRDTETDTPEGTKPDQEEESAPIPEQMEEVPMTTEGVWRMIDWANCDIQTRADHMAFDEEYIYFQFDSDTYRCHYDGTGVEKLDQGLYTMFTTDGIIWGFWAEPGYDPEGEGIYSLDPVTLERTLEVEMPESARCYLVLVSGDWLCYLGSNYKDLIVRNLKTGEEKIILEPHTPGGKLSNIAACVYGNTLYILFGTIPEEEQYRHEWMLASYELGSGAEKATELLADLYPGGFRSSFWMEEGMLLLDTSEGAQYYYAKFSEIDENGNWDYKKEENKVGTDLLAEDALPRTYDEIPFQMNGRYILGNDLVFIEDSSIRYYTGFDFTTCEILWEGDMRNQPLDNSHGIYNGSVYIFLREWKSDVYEIMKISEGGVVEHIPITIPEEE